MIECCDRQSSRQVPRMAHLSQATALRGQSQVLDRYCCLGVNRRQVIVFSCLFLFFGVADRVFLSSLFKGTDICVQRWKKQAGSLFNLNASPELVALRFRPEIHIGERARQTIFHGTGYYEDFLTTLEECHRRLMRKSTRIA